MTQPPEPYRWGHRVLRVVMAPLRVLVAILVVLDELARPLYRPVAEWFAGLKLVRRAEVAIARLPPYGVLLVLAVPLIGVEPLKLLALLWIGQGRIVPGVLLMGFAYAGSFLVVERIYHAGHGKLMRIGWVAVAMAIVTRIRESVIAWVRTTRVWAVAMEAVQTTRAWRLAVIRAFRSGRAGS